MKKPVALQVIGQLTPELLDLRVLLLQLRAVVSLLPQLLAVELLALVRLWLFLTLSPILQALIYKP